MRDVVVVGIDPGTRRCGFGVVARTGSRLTVVESGVLEPGDHPLPRRLALIFEALEALLARAGAAEVAVESVFAGVSPRSALVLGHARGVVLAAAARAGLPVFEYAPAEAKVALTGNGRAEKPQLLRMVRALFGVEAGLADEADAIALAVCHLSRLGARGLRAAAVAGPGGATGPPGVAAGAARLASVPPGAPARPRAAARPRRAVGARAARRRRGGGAA
jgi:crossover junction endodeoxyribonuclease RuvC